MEKEKCVCVCGAETKRILDRVREAPILPQDLEYFPAVHVIDLAEDGYIKPHVDSIKVLCICPYAHPRRKTNRLCRSFQVAWSLA